MCLNSTCYHGRSPTSFSEVRLRKCTIDRLYGKLSTSFEPLSADYQFSKHILTHFHYHTFTNPNSIQPTHTLHLFALLNTSSSSLIPLVLLPPQPQPQPPIHINPLAVPLLHPNTRISKQPCQLRSRSTSIPLNKNNPIVQPRSQTHPIPSIVESPSFIPLTTHLFQQCNNAKQSPPPPPIVHPIPPPFLPLPFLPPPFLFPTHTNPSKSE